VSLTKFFWLYGDYGYIFKDRRTLTTNIQTVDNNVHYTSQEYGLEFSYPTVHRVAPFLHVGGGILHESYSETHIGRLPSNAGSAFFTAVNNHPMVAYGGGVRYFVRDHWGLVGSVSGYYLTDPVYEVLPGLTSLNPASFAVANLPHHGFGEVSGGLFWHFR
jgi:hypothetical protein